MIDETKAKSVIENSFIAPLLKFDTVTDISFNGKDIFYQDNYLGRQRSDIQISNSEVNDFLRQIANLTEKRFSVRDPILDTSIGKYRLNGVHQSLARKNHQKVSTFSLRIANDSLDIKKDEFFISSLALRFLKFVIDKGTSILIGGKTGTGKTVLQKALLHLMNENSRIVVIDNVLELDSVFPEKELDMTIWQADDQNEDKGISFLVKNALRSNPDWLIVAEARGEEMRDVLNSALTGHPIITTMHSLNIETMISRVISMVMMANKKISYKEVKNDIMTHFRILIYLSKYERGNQIVRYVNKIAYINETKELDVIYENDGKEKHYYKLNDEIKNEFKLSEEFINLWSAK